VEEVVVLNGGGEKGLRRCDTMYDVTLGMMMM
jgi:hypothetical protein